MPAPRNRKHLLVPTPPSSEEYTPHARKIVLPPVPGPRNRRQHASALKAALLQAERETKQERDALDITVQGAEPGLYVQFESPPGIELKLESLEDRGKGIELVAVQSLKRPQQPPVQLATVFVPDGQLKHFVTRFQQYATEQTKKGEPRHKDLVDRIAALRRATLHALWTDAVDVYPRDDEVIWWEVWLRRHDGRELERLLEFAGQVELIVGERRLAFDDRIVVLVKGSAAQLSTSLDVLNDVAEVRRAKDTATAPGGARGVRARHRRDARSPSPSGRDRPERRDGSGSDMGRERRRWRSRQHGPRHRDGRPRRVWRPRGCPGVPFTRSAPAQGRVREDPPADGDEPSRALRGDHGAGGGAAGGKRTAPPSRLLPRGDGNRRARPRPADVVVRSDRRACRGALLRPGHAWSRVSRPGRGGRASPLRRQRGQRGQPRRGAPRPERP